MYPTLPRADIIKEVERRILDDDFKTKVNKDALIRLAKLSMS